jgi:8-oxo-dGTP diphosphatase
MQKDQSLTKFFEHIRIHCLPNLSIDVVIFGFHDDRLKILLQRFFNSDHFVLLGGYIEKEENLHDSAVRILKERTGLDQIYLEQYYTFGDTDRLKTDLLQKVSRKSGADLPDEFLHSSRTISICYYSLVDYTKVKPMAGPFSMESIWFDIENLPPLLFDHEAMIQKAMQTLQSDLDRKLNGFNLMGETFTMADLQKLYEAVLQKKLVRTNFQRKMLSLGILERLEKQYTGKAHKAPYLYRFRVAR